MGRFIAATMRWISFLLVLSPALVFGATYEETRNVVDSADKKFKCTYKLNYNNKGVFSKAKSTATCTPRKSGKVVEETFDIKEIGKSVTVKHTIKKGKKTITSISVKDYVAPTTTAAPAPAPDMTHAGCSQQINDFINNGGAEDAITNLVESGQLENMVMNFVESGQAEQLIGQMMENIDMEQMVGQAMENVDMEEMM